MPVLTCLANDHNGLLVLLSVLVCLFGSSVTVKLSHRAIHSRGWTGLHWLFLAAVCSGFSIWATHFIAMLGYQPGVAVHFDATLTIVSALMAIAGTAIGLAFARLQSRKAAVICGGTMVGLTISAMHYMGMFAYRADGLVTWTPNYVVASILTAMLLSTLAIDRLRAKDKEALGQAWDATMLLVGAILLLHFIGMTAFHVAPIDGYSKGMDSDVFTAMAAAIAVAALVIVGIGVSAHLVEDSRAEAKAYLRQIATLDMLTGLSNRHSFVTTLQDACARLHGGGQPFALFMIDLDRFKAVNDTMGHAAGDLLLICVAERLRRFGYPSEMICRIGGDEFAMIAFGIDHTQAAYTIADEVVTALSAPFRLGEAMVEIGASVGGALAPAHSTDAETLTQQADEALYIAKQAGRARTCLFDPASESRSVFFDARLPSHGISRAALEHL